MCYMYHISCLNRFSRILLLLVCVASLPLCSCTKEEETYEESFSYARKSYNMGMKASSQEITFTTNCNWEITTPADVDWVSVSPSMGNGNGTKERFKVILSVTGNDSGKSRSAVLTLSYGSGKKSYNLEVNQKFLGSCLVKNITDDMIFSTVPSGSSSSVQQGFDVDWENDVMYFSQVSGGYKNVISWAKRQQFNNSTSTASDKMTLMYFSHGNNIRFESKSGTDYIWIGNYGTRDSDDNYTGPQILSRVPVKKGATVKNTETTENYYFGVKNLHASFDLDNDLLAIYSQQDSYTMRIYRISDVLRTPVSDVTLKYSITYGGGSNKPAPDPEWSGKPVVKAHDCTTLTPLHTLKYNYVANGRAWQTYCIYNNKVYFFTIYKNPKNGMEFQSVIDVLDFEGKMLRSDILQPFADNIDDLVRYRFTDEATAYMENEGIIIHDGVLYLLYSAKNAASFRRPVIFQFDAACLD